MLCERFFTPRHPLVSYVLANFNVRTWCDCWKQYLELLMRNIGLNINTLVILPRSVLNGSFYEVFSRNLEDYPITKWVVLADNEHSGAGFQDRSSLNSTNIIVRPGDIDFSQDGFWIEQSALRRKTRKTQVRLTKLTSRHLRLGCLGDIQLSGGCLSIKNDAFQEALRVLKVPVMKVPINYNGSVKTLNRKTVDILNVKVALDPHGYKRVFYPGIRHYHHVVYYVGQKAVRQGNVLSLSSFLEFFSILFVSLVACLLTFSMINYSAGRNARSDIADTCMALMAGVLMLSSAVPRNIERSSSGRTVLICWYMGGFSLCVYCQSLLTSSVSSGMRWEADDTPTKLRPKLMEGKVSICTERATYSNLLLASSVNDTDILGDMSRATKYYRNLFFSGTVQQCFDKVARLTHVFLSGSRNPCEAGGDKYGNSITVGKEPIQPLFTGQPVKKGSGYRREFAFIMGRLFETGWDKRVDLLKSWNSSCSTLTAPPIVPLDLSRFLTLYFMCCGFSVLVLVLEIAVNRLRW